MSYHDAGKGNVMFPSRDIPEEEKNLPQYHLNYAQAIWDRYVNDKCAIRFSDNTWYDLIRLYGRGEQPVEIYKNYLQGDDSVPPLGTGTVTNDTGSKGRKGWDNIDWDIVSPLPRVRSIIKSYMDQFGHDVFVDAVDAMSGDIRESVKWRSYAVAKNFEFIKDFHLEAGLPMEELEFLPANVTELNLYEAMGGFKMNFARAMEKLLRYTDKISDLEDNIVDKFRDDAMDLGVIAAKVELDDVTKKFKYRYVDPKNLVMQYVDNGEYERSEYAGEKIIWTVSELKQYLPEKEEDFFKNLAKDYNDKIGNKRVDGDDWDNFSKRQRDGSYLYDNFRVEVFDVEWIDYECRRHLIYDTSRGRKFVKELRLDTELKAHGRAKDVRTKMRKLRQAKWVVGTDIVFDHGMANMQDRPKQSTVLHNFKLITLKDKPLTESLKPIADDLALVWFKYQNGRALSVQSGYSVDVGMMQNIGDGGDKFGFLKLIEKWRSSGILLHQQSIQGNYQGGKTSPISTIPSIMQDVMAEAMQAWEFALRRIEDVTGINLVVLGASTSPDAAVGTTQLSSQAALHAIKGLIDAEGKMKARLSETTMRRLQLAFKARRDIADAYRPIVGSMDIDSLIFAEKDAVQYGLTFEPRPSQKAKDNVIQAALAAMQSKREGGPGLTLTQYTYIINQLEGGGNLKELGALLDFLVTKSEAQIEEQKNRNIQLQSQMNQQNQQAKSQADMQIEQLKGQIDLALQDKKGKDDLKNTMVTQYPDLFRGDAQQIAGLPPEVQESGLEPRSPQSNAQVPLE